MPAEISRISLTRRRIDIGAIIANPGTLYNAGNLIAFIGSMALFLLVLEKSQSLALNGFVMHFLGNWPAALTTLSTILFWLGGMKYAAAWVRGFPPDQGLNRSGHALSMIGALIIGIALMLLARTEVALALALIATILHAGGKMGSWLAPDDDFHFKPMPFYSRIPYVTTLLLDVRSDWLISSSPADFAMKATLPSFLFLATMLWARADWLLLPREKD